MTTDGTDERARSGQRSVLMVLYFFPPLGGISMSRNVRNVQYLPRHGWSPVVLTPRDAAYHLKDPQAVGLIPDGTQIIRTRSFEAGHARSLVARGGGFIAGMRSGRNAGNHSTAERPNGTNPGDPATNSPGRLERIRRLLFFPDDQVGWLPFAVLAALRAHRQTPFDAIYSTSSPITAHLVAAILKRRTGLPWIAEFRDPWVGNALAAPLPWLHRRLQVKLERWIVGSADRVIGVSEGITALYRARYPDAPEMVTITSGYDRGETRNIDRTRNGDGPFRIVYTGTLDRPAEFETFLEGVDALLTRRPDLKDRLTFSFYGSVADACRAIADRFSAGGLGGVIHLRGFVPREAALAALDEAEAALILLGAGPGMGLFIGGKLFDYIGQSVQVLAMLPRGDARGILESLEWGVVCEPDPVDVGRAIEHLLSLPPPDRRADPTGKYDRATLAGRLAASLDEIATRPPGSNEAAPKAPKAPISARHAAGVNE
jgi:glycosyltransferase involved in cell wall biosynthesis